MLSQTVALTLKRSGRAAGNEALAEPVKFLSLVLQRSLPDPGNACGQARDLAAEHAQLAIDIAAGRGPVEPPCVILSGGETTVRVTGDGRGGRNGEYGLALATALAGHERITAIAADTDGIDGAGDNAGCMVFPDSLQRSSDDAVAMLANNDSYAFFASLGDLVMTGPTRTNVNDFRAILVR